jgi:hypothetical protein
MLVSILTRCVSADIFAKTLIHNYSLEARINPLPVPGEDAAAIAARTARAEAYTTAVNQIKTLWKSAYKTAFNRKYDVLQAPRSSISTDAIVGTRQLMLLKHKMDNPPTVGVDVDTIHNRDQAESAKVVLLLSRPKDSRCTFWKAKLDKNVFASFFKDSRDVVDVW